MRSPIDVARANIDMADRHRKVANAAEMARVNIRLGRDPKVERRRTFRVDTKVFDAFETQALYEALAIVRDDNEKAAADYERRALEAGK